MSEQDNTLTQEEAAFQAKWKVDSGRIRQFYDAITADQDANGEANPQYQLAPEYFQIYLERKPSTIATQALERAFSMWGQLKGVSGQVQNALTNISYEEDVWDKIADGILYAFWNDGDIEGGYAQVEKLVQDIIPLKSKATVLNNLSRRWLQRGDIEKARQGFEQILKWDLNECDWYVEHDAKGCLYEIEYLNVGQLAPHFLESDIDGNRIDLQDYRERIVLLDFWASWCGPCHGEFPHLRNLVSRYSQDRLFLIGISLDEDLVALRQCVEKEQLNWPHICEGKCWLDPLAKLFNIIRIPQTYILDQKGYIAFKGKRESELEEVVRSLMK